MAYQYHHQDHALGMDAAAAAAGNPGGGFAPDTLCAAALFLQGTAPAACARPRHGSGDGLLGARADFAESYSYKNRRLKLLNLALKLYLLRFQFGASPGEGTGATMSDDEDNPVDSESNMFDGNDVSDGMGFGMLTEGERSLVERVRQELKHELKQGYREKLVDIREEILRKRRAGKLPGDTASTLKAWWQAHAKWPYPTEEDKARLVQETGLQLKQINNWFINQRKRNWHSNPTSSSSDKSKRKSCFVARRRARRRGVAVAVFRQKKNHEGPERVKLIITPGSRARGAWTLGVAAAHVPRAWAPLLPRTSLGRAKSAASKMASAWVSHGPQNLHKTKDDGHTSNKGLFDS
uniref:Homeobox protein knotted-1-like 11 n=1 Tax=Aegilops tauschii TaxID=37682 RepID=M8BLF9_AEGTA